MRAFYDPEQARHDPLQYMRFGRVVPPKDLPARTARLLEALDRQGMTPEAPQDAGMAPILAVHDAGYVDFLESAWDEWQRQPEAERGPEVWPATFPYWSGRPEAPTRGPCPASGFLGRLGWYLGDMSVPMREGSWPAIRRSAMTAVAGADAVAGGEAAAYALCRPSGHHARADRGSGFCYVNNSAIAAERLRGRFGRVAILDIDVHHGDGTQQIFYHRPEVLTVSIHADPSNFYPFYTGYPDERGVGAGEGANLNLPLAPGSGGAAMQAAIAQAGEAIAAHGPGALVVALGFDAHAADPIGALTLTTQDFEAAGRAIRALGLPTLLVQEGGYAIEVIGDCLDAFLTGFR